MQRDAPGRIGVFGLGVVGKLLVQFLDDVGFEVAGYSRSSSFGQGQQLDAARKDACRDLLHTLSPRDVLFITFPPQQAHPVFFDLIQDVAPRRILLGTTSIYQRPGRGEHITEKSPLRADHERLSLENLFLESGGNIVRLSGIYGPLRNPVRWVLEGRVGYEKRQVNLVHHDDIARALVLLTSAPALAPVYNLSDGQNHTWKAIIDFLVEQGILDRCPPPQPPKRPHSFIENSLFRGHFPDFAFRDFWNEVSDLASHPDPGQ